MHSADRGLFELMRGRPVLLASSGADGNSDARLVAAVEGITTRSLDRLASCGTESVRLAITGYRARSMGLGAPGDSENVPPVVSIGLASSTTPEILLRLTSSMGAWANGDIREASTLESSGLALARAARLLPAVVSTPVRLSPESTLGRAVGDGEVLRIDASEVDAITRSDAVDLVRVTEAPVPLRDAEAAHFVLYREFGGLLEHVAIVVGDHSDRPDPVPVRLHSACLTGDLFGSLRCDCGEQLQRSIRIFTARGGGILLYLSQEGRGIGLGNKLRAYALQQDGLDTIDADCTLGFGADERTYEVAVRMLGDLGVQRIQLLTNNPEKVRALRRAGIDVSEREPLHGTLNRHNLPYVRAKVHRAGHWLEDMLAERVREP